MDQSHVPPPVLKVHYKMWGQKQKYVYIYIYNLHNLYNIYNIYGFAATALAVTNRQCEANVIHPKLKIKIKIMLLIVIAPSPWLSYQ